ncbi:EAL domain-containing protein [Marinomonas balearica]|uniref:EAL domain-containing protein (Putative c-di-GMP-specific phosphodiesterase class I) n=1 Tax=Marinomonas balearica TaxID=491947 RepID=A0A4R6MH37_9GAMM|nr:EAL domain-containing protein [Marinomonas balearica]TDP01249.1 EAL domain-containing protein (putative c-di-GMP-specific phosphodiesterase class I) [Marinomonas balearica]
MPKKYESLVITRVYSRFFAVVAIVSVVLMAFSHSSFNQKAAPLFTDPLNDIRANYTVNEPVTDQIAQFQTIENGFILQCHVSLEHPIEYCGGSLVFPREAGKEVSFEDIDEFSFDIELDSNAPGYDGRFRMFIKSIIDGGFDPHPENSHVKYHAVRVDGSGHKSIPLNRFDVETWWENKYQIAFSEAYKDFSKIHSVEFAINDVPVKAGDYKIRVSNLVAHGRVIDVDQLNQWLLYGWVSSLVLFLLHYAWLNNRLLSLVRRNALHDANTGLLNAAGFEDSLRTFDRKSGYFYLIKLTNWQNLVKHFGVITAQELIKKSQIHVSNLLDDDSIIMASLESDELALYSPKGRLSVAQEKALIETLKEGETFEQLGHICLEVKVGIIEESLLKRESDTWIHSAREVIDSISSVHDEIKVYTDEVHEAVRYSAYIEQEVRKGLAEDKFHLLFLPVYDATRNQIIGAEALLRSSLDSLSNLSPQVYVTVAEKTGLIREIDCMVMNKSLKALESLSLPDDFIISINISAQELLDTTFIDRFEEAVGKSSISPSQLRLEITETSFVDLNQANTDMLERVRELGCSISLDDFGTGYTSFNHLKNIPVDEIKIDREFVNEMDEYETSVIIKSMITIARSFKYDLVAEGIETQSQIESLYALGCTRFQGYFISKPTQLTDVIDLNERLKSNELTLINAID